MPGKCVSYHARQLFNVDAHNVTIGSRMKISTARLKQIIHEETYKRYQMVHEIREMGDELLEDVEKGLLEDMMSQPTFDAKVAWVKTNKPKIKNPEGYVAAAMRKVGELK